MEMTHAGLLLLLFCSAYSYQFGSGTGRSLPVQDPKELELMEAMMEEETQGASVPRKPASSKANEDTFPKFKLIPFSKYPKEAFMPEKGARPLPDFAKDILVVPSSHGTAAPEPAATKPVVKIFCPIGLILVIVLHEEFKSVDAYKYMRLGSCPSNGQNSKYYFFLYKLTNCGFQKESLTDYLSYSNVLHYNPPGPVVRDLPFDLPVQCKYHRLFHSYKVGFKPKLLGGTVFKALTPKQSAVLEAQDAYGHELTGSKTYTLGQPMFFEAKKADVTARSGDRRLYINKCFMTANQSPKSHPQYTVIENQGCMIDSQLVSQSMFLSGSSKMSQKFQVVAFVFKDWVSTSSFPQHLYIHCEITIGQSTPSPSSKACNYDAATKMWKELYGHDSVCTCCETSCPSALHWASKKTISSASWKVNMSNKDGHVNVEPQVGSLDADQLGFEDSDMEEHKDFLNYWEDDDD